MLFLVQARSQKFAMGGFFGGLGAEPQPLEAGGLGAKPPASGGTEVWGRAPALNNFAFFCKNNLNLGLL